MGHSHRGPADEPAARRVDEPAASAGRVRAEDLIAQVASARGVVCAGCGAALCGHDLLGSIAVGARHEPRCPACLGRALGREPAALATDLGRYLGARDCYRCAWAWISRQEPGCPAAARVAAAPPTGDDDPDDAAGDDPDDAAGPPAHLVVFHDRWDAGELGCGELVLELRLRLRRMAPRQVIHLTALDAGAPADIPAWCRLTGHALVAHSHPVYLIRKKED